MRIFGMLLMGISLTSSTAVMAQSLPVWKAGKINSVYADPSDVVVIMDSNGPCGSPMFNIRRSSANFIEMTALMYTAAASNRQISLNVASCDGDRNAVSHGGAQF